MARAILREENLPSGLSMQLGEEKICRQDCPHNVATISKKSRPPEGNPP
jgi:hypothetical protein